MNSHDTFPSAKLMVELQALAKTPAHSARTRQAWQLFLEAASNDDYPMVQDLALELGLVLSCLSDGDDRQAPVSSPVWRNPWDGSEMIWIPPGPFYVGPFKRQSLKSAGFSLARFPVTNGQFQRFLQATGYQPAVEHSDNDKFLAHWKKGTFSVKLEHHPVVFVLYVDALAYCHWVGMTLPTEWLWEKAARGADGRPFPWGDLSPKQAVLTNLASKGTCVVGEYPRTRSPYGCEDLVGNVSEWCQLSETPTAVPPPARVELPALPTADGSYAAVRGSCFLRSNSRRMAAWHRRRLSPMRRNQWVGFRPAVFLPYRPAE